MFNEIIDAFSNWSLLLQIFYPLSLILGIFLLKKGIRKDREGKEQISLLLGGVFILSFLLMTLILLR